MMVCAKLISESSVMDYSKYTELWHFYIFAAAFIFSIFGYNALDVVCFVLSLSWIYIHTVIPDAQLRGTQAAAAPFPSSEESVPRDVDQIKIQAQRRLRQRRQTAWLVLFLSPVSLYLGLYVLVDQPENGYLCGLINVNFVVVCSVVRVLLKVNAASEAALHILAEEATVPTSLLQTTRKELKGVKAMLTQHNADIARLQQELKIYRAHLQNSIRVVSTVETDGRETEDYVFHLEERLRQLEHGQASTHSWWSTLTAFEWPHHKAGRLLRTAIHWADPTLPTNYRRASPASLPWLPRRRRSSTASSSSSCVSSASERSAFQPSLSPVFTMNQPDAQQKPAVTTQARPAAHDLENDASLAPANGNMAPRQSRRKSSRTEGHHSSALPKHRANRGLVSATVPRSSLLRD
eukprot:TRINITY_DN9931_c0_g3_i1.p1 TRINITY_DN9931_c0_g3~~TRINITY_DN9931_c0_g3_i1.p1  ORF type:complete len:407 (+),score=38.64 TRINITY_DN9931_c0_g3_i1:164-1384(+)